MGAYYHQFSDPTEVARYSLNVKLLSPKHLNNSPGSGRPLLSLSMRTDPSETVVTLCLYLLLTALVCACATYTEIFLPLTAEATAEAVAAHLAIPRLCYSSAGLCLLYLSKP